MLQLTIYSNQLAWNRSVYLMIKPELDISVSVADGSTIRSLALHPTGTEQVPVAAIKTLLALRHVVRTKGSLVINHIARLLIGCLLEIDL